MDVLFWALLLRTGDEMICGDLKLNRNLHSTAIQFGASAFNVGGVDFLRGEGI